jgi:hypothetical protein
MKHLSCVLFLIIMISSCETSFDPNITSAPTPLVYGIICPQDSLYYIRLTKTFIGEGNAYDFAKITDSIYYQNARVFLETRDLNGELIERVQMEEYIIEDRLPGIFAASPNRIFQTDVSKIHLRPEYFSTAGKSYDLNLHLRAVIPGYPDTVYSVTRLRNIPRLTEPRSNYTKVYFYNENPFWMQWSDTNTESFFQILVRMHYTDFLYDDEREMVAEWVLTGINVNMTSFPGGDRKVYSYYFRPENFFSKIRSVIKTDYEVEARVCRKLDFIVLSSNPEFEYYRNVYEISDDYHGTSYTNIVNGYGLFSTFSSTGIYGMTLGQEELDSLADGIYTKGLKFRNYQTVLSYLSQTRSQKADL